MGALGYIFTGGFASGYRTYIGAGLLVATALAGYATGETNLIQTLEAVAGGLGLAGLRAVK